jgi:hypothetical protein
VTARNANEFKEVVGATGSMELAANQALQLCGEGGLLGAGSAPVVPMLSNDAAAATFGAEGALGPQKLAPAGEKKKKGPKAAGARKLPPGFHKPEAANRQKKQAPLATT